MIRFARLGMRPFLRWRGLCSGFLDVLSTPFMDAIKDPVELREIYSNRFDGMLAYRMKVWKVLCGRFFSRYVPKDSIVLDIGAGYGEFINNVESAGKYAMDLNPNTGKNVDSDVRFIQQDCSETWPLAENSLDIVFTSNFFEHLPDKGTLRKTLIEAHRCLKSGGKLIAMGPNIKYVPGAYWDFWDHFLCLTDLSLSEALMNNGYAIEERIPRFLPYTMVNQPQYPVNMLRVYLALPILWRLFGKQFLVVASKK